jgi:glycosyltransferase involved in cell wall biosynthesis
MAAPLGAVDGIHVLTAQDPNGFAQHVRALVGDPGLRSQLGHAGRSLSTSQFSQAAIDRQLAAAYQLALDARNNRLRRVQQRPFQR